MTSADDWQQRNDEHLAASLRWLALRLQRLAAAGAAAQASTPPQPEPVVVAGPSPRRRWSLFRRDEAERPERDEPPSLPVEVPTADPDRDVADAEAAVRSLEESAVPPALVVLAERLGLSTFERDVLLLSASVELAPGLGRLCAAAQGDPAATYPTFALALVLFDDPAWEALSPERPLRAARLIEISHAADAALITSPFRADERIVSYLKGLNQLDDRLSPFIVPLAIGSPPTDPAPSQSAIAMRLAGRLAAVDEDAPVPVVHLAGPSSANKQLVAAEVSRLLGRHLLRVPATAVPTTPNEVELFARLWQRERVLLPLALYLDASELPSDPGASESVTATIARILGRTDGLRFLDAPDAVATSGAIAVDVGTPTSEEQRALWAAALGADAGDCPAVLAAQFDLDPVAIARAARTATAAAEAGDEQLLDRLWGECLAITRPKLDALAQRIEPLATWDDLVLPDEPQSLLRLIVEQVRHRSTVYDDWGVARRMNRGLGISALFAGESGTGKTMAAEVIARELRLDLYRIDLSAVVSKYIGETEKNLRRVFDSAEGAGALLFFDEADALFGKRTEVKDSHDRYANIEVNYLLQRMESYRGLAVLATNRRASLDPAFVRRLRFVVEFPFPSAAERERIWTRAFGEAVAVEDLDHVRLADLSLSGGSIQNVALDATFAAAAARTPVTMPLVLAAVGRELRKQGRPVNEVELRWTSTQVRSR